MLDFGKPPIISMAVELVKACADICHQSPKNALFVKYPVKTKGMCMKTHLNFVRKLEDALMNQNLSIDCAVDIVYDTSGFHGNDARDGTGKGRLCVSSNFAESPWLSCHAVANHMRINNVPVVSFGQMRSTPHEDVAHSSEHLSPAERSAQLGPKAWQMVLKALMCGRTDEVKTEDRKVVVVDAWPQVGDIMEACWALYNSWSTGGDNPDVAAIAFYVCKEPVERSKLGGLRSMLKGNLLRTWWEPSAEAGNAEPSRTEATTVRKPDLKLLAWGSEAGAVKIPDVVKARFDEAECKDEWHALCADISKQLKGLSKLACADFTRSGSNTVGINLTGPEIGEGETSVDVNRDITPDAQFTACADMNMDEVFSGGFQF